MQSFNGSIRAFEVPTRSVSAGQHWADEFLVATGVCETVSTHHCTLLPLSLTQVPLLRVSNATDADSIFSAKHHRAHS